MQALTDTLLPIVNTINGYLSDYILVFLLMGAGLYFSFKTKFVQVRCFGEGMKRVFGNLTLSGKKHESGMSSSRRWPQPSLPRLVPVISSAPLVRS